MFFVLLFFSGSVDLLEAVNIQGNTGKSQGIIADVGFCPHRPQSKDPLSEGVPDIAYFFGSDATLLSVKAEEVFKGKWIKIFLFLFHSFDN